MSYVTPEKAREYYEQRKLRSGYAENNRAKAKKWARENPERYKEIQRKSRLNNLENEYATAKAKRTTRRQILWDAKDVPCMDCGIKYHPVQMDFDHRPGTLKVKDVSKMLCVSLNVLLLEIEKCDVICSNCHRMRTYNRSQLNGNIS